MDEATNQRARRKLSFLSFRHSQQPSFSQFYSQNHSSNYLQLAIHNLTQLIKQSEQQLIDEQQSIINDEKHKLTRIETLQTDINGIQSNIDSLSQEMDKLTFDTYDMLVRQSESALIRHNQVLKESIEHINQVLRKRSFTNDSSFDQLKKDLIHQQEKLFLIRNQMDIDHNKLTTNMSILRECQEQRNQFEQNKNKKQLNLQTIQHTQDDTVQKQIHVQKLRISIEQQTRVRDEMQQLERYIEPKIDPPLPPREQPIVRNEAKEELDLITTRFLDSVIEVDEEDSIETDSKSSDDRNHHSFNGFKEYPEESDDE